MRTFRRFAWIFALALALAVGQHAGLVHALSHPGEPPADSRGKKPVSPPCELCAAAAQLSGMPSCAMLVAASAAGVVVSSPWAARPAPASTVVVFRSRGPPALS